MFILDAVSQKIPHHYVKNYDILYHTFIGVRKFVVFFAPRLLDLLSNSVIASYGENKRISQVMFFFTRNQTLQYKQFLWGYKPQLEKQSPTYKLNLDLKVQPPHSSVEGDPQYQDCNQYRLKLASNRQVKVKLVQSTSLRH